LNFCAFFFGLVWFGVDLSLTQNLAKKKNKIVIANSKSQKKKKIKQKKNPNK